MYTIAMRDDKRLETITKATLHQRENLVDKIQFLFPQTYCDQSLSEFTPILKYIDQLGVYHSELLKLEDDLYKDKYLRYTLPIDTALTQYPGDVKIRITMSKTNLDDREQMVLHTGTTTIHIDSINEYCHFTPDSALEFVDQIVGVFDAKIQQVQEVASYYQESKADDLIRADDADGAKVQLTSNGKLIGNPVSIDCEEIPAVDLNDTPEPGDEDTGCNCGCNDVVEF